MAGLKISELTELTTPTGDEELVYAKNGINGKIKLKNAGGMPTPTLITRTAGTFDLSNYSWVMLVYSYKSSSEQRMNACQMIYLDFLDWSVQYHSIYCFGSASNTIGSVGLTGTSKSSVTVSFNSMSDVALYGL